MDKFFVPPKEKLKLPYCLKHITKMTQIKRKNDVCHTVIGANSGKKNLVKQYVVIQLFVCVIKKICISNTIVNTL